MTDPGSGILIRLPSVHHSPCLVKASVVLALLVGEALPVAQPRVVPVVQEQLDGLALALDVVQLVDLAVLKGVGAAFVAVDVHAKPVLRL
jgi:hypothetical protein